MCGGRGEAAGTRARGSSQTGYAQVAENRRAPDAGATGARGTERGRARGDTPREVLPIRTRALQKAERARAPPRPRWAAPSARSTRPQTPQASAAVDGRACCQSARSCRYAARRKRPSAPAGRCTPARLGSPTLCGLGRMAFSLPPPPRPRLMRCSGTATKWPRPKKKGRIATVAQRFRGVAQRAAYCRPLLCTRRRRAACALSDPAHVLTPSSTASSRPDGAPAAAAAHAPPQRPSRGGAPNGKRSSRPACLLEVCVIGQQRCGHCALGRGRAVASACPRTQRGRARMRRPRTQQRTLLGRRRRRKRHLHEVGAAEHARARAARKPVADVRARRLQLRRLRGALRRLSNGERARARGRRLRRARISKV